MKSDSRKKWTVMVYLAGDNDLNDDMIASLKSLHALRGNPGCNIFAYYATSNLPREAVLYDFREKKTEGAPLKDFEQPNLGTAACAVEMGNSADRKTVVNFVKGCRQVAKTEHNVLILSSHADSFLGRSLLKDETSMKVMSFGELTRALGEVTSELPGRKLDILGFDSCVMGMVEIAYELRPFTKVLVAPQDFTPSSGWNYQEMLCSLAVPKPKDDPVDHAKCFVKNYVCFQRDFTVGGRSVEIAACNLDCEFETLVDKINDLAYLLRVELPHVRPSTPPTKDGTYGDDKVGNETRGFVYTRLIDLLLCSHWSSQTHMQDQSVDLSHFCFSLFIECQKLIHHICIIRGDPVCKPKNQVQADPIDPEVARLRAKLEQISDLCADIYQILRGKGGKGGGIVIHNDHAGNEEQFSFGLSLFFPWSRLGFVLSYDTYKKLAFNKGERKSWLKLINRITVETQRQNLGPFEEEALRRRGIQKPKLRSELKFENVQVNVFEDHLLDSFEGHRYDPPGKGALAAFRERFGKVKNYPMQDLNEPDCTKTIGSDCDPKEK